MRAAVLALLLCACASNPPTPAPVGLAIGASPSMAGAIDSLTFRGVQYIDAFDHGRELQSAVSFDGKGEALNPTEAGSRTDPRGSTSSVLVSITQSPTRLQTQTRMAYWDAVDGQILSDTTLRKDVQVDGQLLRFDLSFDTATPHELGQFEILTGYMTAAFSRFRVLVNGELQELDDGPGEQPYPVIFCTGDDMNCMGVVSPSPLVGGGYGRWRFIGRQCTTKAGPTGCVKWNAVSRIPNQQTVSFTVFVAVGTLEEVRALLTSQLH